MTDDLAPEDAKLVTLARGARGRAGVAAGAAVRDETGRTYSGADVTLPMLVAVRARPRGRAGGRRRCAGRRGRCRRRPRSHRPRPRRAPVPRRTGPARLGLRPGRHRPRPPRHVTLRDAESRRRPRRPRRRRPLRHHRHRPRPPRPRRPGGRRRRHAPARRGRGPRRLHPVAPAGRRCCRACGADRSSGPWPWRSPATRRCSSWAPRAPASPSARSSRWRSRPSSPACSAGRCARAPPAGSGPCRPSSPSSGVGLLVSGSLSTGDPVGMLFAAGAGACYAGLHRPRRSARPRRDPAERGAGRVLLDRRGAAPAGRGVLGLVAVGRRAGRSSCGSAW